MAHLLDPAVTAKPDQTPSQRPAAGVFFIAEDRKDAGLLQEMNKIPGIKFRLL